MRRLFCAATFLNSEVTAIHKAPGDYPNGREGEILTVEFNVCGIPCLGINGGPQFKQTEAFSFQIATDTQEETDLYWKVIVSNGGEESACGWCEDRWGISWQITPRVRGNDGVWTTFCCICNKRVTLLFVRLPGIFPSCSPRPRNS